MTELKKVKWKKLGGGSFRMGSGKIIKPNQIFEAYPHEIPDGAKDVVKCLEPDKLPENTPLKSVSEYAIKPSEQDNQGEKSEEEDEYVLDDRGRGWFDVVNVASGKPINENALREDEAIAILEQLQA